MFLSVFDVFKVGIGPSSSHTIGPMNAARRFVGCMQQQSRAGDIAKIRVYLHGSLAFTGKGHATDKAIVPGLLGLTPDELDPDLAADYFKTAEDKGIITVEGLGEVAFRPSDDIVFDYETEMPGHANGMRFVAQDAGDAIVAEKAYYSVGGGFVLDEEELADLQKPQSEQPALKVPHPFRSATEMLVMGAETGLDIAGMKLANELADNTAKGVDAKLDHLWAVMNGSIDKGIETEGILDGGLNVKRRAKHIFDKLNADQSNTKFAHTVLDWVSVYAMAVNEENAGGGRIVTAPTNGAAGVVPAVIRYYLEFCPGADHIGVREFLLVAGAIGGLIKYNASISGAEVGCQGEVGSASAMAAAGLAHVLGGTNEQIENAAEIALEHHLGMTCDPIGGLVQVPCIERNAMGAIKAISAASLALKGDGTHFVPLDSAIKTMKETGRDMLSKYKETSQGGLAVNTVEC
jgi:L-serine dehydratase